MAKVSFGTGNSAFSIALKKRVDEFFATQKVCLTGNRKLYWKTGILFTSAAFLYTILVFNTPVWWVALPLCMLMGLNFAAIGFNVMHDGAHGSYSRKPWVNDIMSYSLDLLGGSSYLWKVKHNVNHHSFTNIEGMDEDIDIQPWMRTHPNQPKRWYHRYQHIYWVLLYGLVYFAWIFIKDFRKYFSGKIATTRFKKMSRKEHIIFWVSKVVYIGVFLVIPIMKIGLAETLIGYGVLSFVCGLTLGVIFQLAHIVEGNTFPEPDVETRKVDENWCIHQLATTANFSTRSRIMSWFAGGLNFQVEHHLFPRISHIHYPEINKVVKEVCEEYDVRYMEHPTLFKALRSHVAHLKVIGNSN